MSAAVSLPSVTSRFRRNDFDVTNTVQVSSTEAVRNAVTDLYRDQWSGVSEERIAQTFETLDALFSGRLPGFHGLDTVYHDRQHTLDVTLAAARLMVGYERTVNAEARLGADRALMGLITAAFHDAGYVREVGDTEPNGARYTSSHVSRSARLLTRFLEAVGMPEGASISANIVHYTIATEDADRIREAMEELSGRMQEIGEAVYGAVYRTARRLFEGRVVYRAG